MDNKEFISTYADNAYFTREIVNPTSASKKGFIWDKPDCAVRALAGATGEDWITAFDWLATRARRDYTMPNDGVAIRRWLVEAGAVWHVCKAEKGKKRMTAKEFALTHKEGRYLVTIASHDTCVIAGKIHDAWNCGEKAVVGYYEMAGFKFD